MKQTDDPIIDYHAPDFTGGQLPAERKTWADHIGTLLMFAAMIGGLWGNVRIFIFMFHEWGIPGIIVALMFVPTSIICPILEWIKTGNPLTFILIYGGFAFLGLISWLLSKIGKAKP